MDSLAKNIILLIVKVKSDTKINALYDVFDFICDGISDKISKKISGEAHWFSKKQQSIKLL
jgi:hypothetical protein